MKTHVSMNAILYKLAPLPHNLTNSEFMGYGRLVNPNGNYNGAETVSLYRLAAGGYGFR